MGRAVVKADAGVLRALGVVLGPVFAAPLPTRIDRRLLKSAFRRRAHELHPDKAHALGLSEAALGHRFRELKHAYDYLLGILATHTSIAVDEVRLPRPAPAPFIVPGNGRSTGRNPRIVRVQAPFGGIPRTAACSRAAGGKDVRPRPSGDHAAGRPRPAAGPAIVTHGPVVRWPPPPPKPRPSLRHSGSIPARRLRFAQYLFYAGVIDWATFVAAMRWQHRTRPLLGEIARELSYLTQDDVHAVLRGQALDERFGEAAIRLRRLDPVRLLTLLGRQRRFDRPIGRYFTENRIVTPASLARLLERHWAHNLACAAAEVNERDRRRRVARG